MEIYLDVNGGEIKVCWQDSEPGSARSRPYLINQNALENCSNGVRAVLSDLNNYSRANIKLQEERDPGWEIYRKIIGDLRWQGKLLRAALISAGDFPDRVQLFEERLAQLAPRELVTFHCGDRLATFPVGFVFDGDLNAPIAAPCRADFHGFWLHKMSPGIRLGGTNCRTSVALEGENIRAVYALNQKSTTFVMEELKRENLDIEVEQFKRLTKINQRDHYNWHNVTSACGEIVENHAIFFVFAHCDQDSLFLEDNERAIWTDFTNMVANRGKGSVGLIIYNCCSSTVGKTGATLLAAGAQKGFCGLVGTEAEIHNYGALRCGIRLMWNLCARNMTLGEAFDDMYNAPDLFPTNLLYTCYAARNFRLSIPIVSDLFEEAA